MNHRLNSGIIQVIVANAFNLLISLFNGFILPKYLSLSTYAYYKEFLLYTTYTGILHLGIVDGLYIKCGGKDLKDIDKRNIYVVFFSMFVMELFFAIVGSAVAMLQANSYLLIAAICIVPLNIIMLFRLLFQATAEFGYYRIIVNVQSISVFIINMLLVFVFRKDDAILYCTGYFLVSMLIMLALIYKTQYSVVNKSIVPLKIIISTLKEYISSGFVVMLGNFMALWIASIDRWFVIANGTTEDFAYYSFATSIIKIINVVLGAFSITLYNYFCDNDDVENVSRVRRKVFLVGTLMISSIFVVKSIIDLYLKKYIESKEIIMILVFAQIFVTIVNSIYLNIYKAQKKQKKYFMIMVAVSGIAVVLNVLFGLMIHEVIIAYAYATLITFMIWMMICQIDLWKYRLSLIEYLYLLIVMIVYLLANQLTPFLGGGVYLLCILVVSFVMFRKESGEIVNDLICMAKKKKT